MEEAITALLASVANGRRYWTRAPQGEAVPYIVLSRISGTPSYTYKGRAGHTSSRVQATCYGGTALDAKMLSRNVIAALDGYRGGMIQGIFVDSDGRDLTAPDAGRAAALFAVAVDFIIHHSG